MKTQKEIDAIIDERIQSELTAVDVETLFDEALDESEDVNICGMSYSQSHALKEIDPIAYRCGLSDFTSEYYELDGLYYENDEVEAIREEVESEAEEEAEAEEVEN